MSRTLSRRLIPAGLVALGFALRTHRLGQADIWWDEGLAVWAVRKSLVQATEWTAGDVHPPLFFWKLWLWIRVAGDGEFAIRLLPALTGTLLLAVIYALAARIGGRRAGLFALALAATARFMVWWSMELRMYTAAALCLALAAYAAVRWWESAGGAASRNTSMRMDAGQSISTRSIGWLTLYTASALATLMTVYLAGAGLIFVALPPLIALARRRAWRPARDWLAAQALALIGFVPWAWYAAERMPSWRIVETPPGLAFVGELWATLLATGISTELAEARVATAVFWSAALGVPLVAMVIAAATVRRSGGRGGRLGTADGRDETESRVRPSPSLPPLPLVPLITLLTFLLATPLLVWAITQPRSIFYSPRVEARYFLPFAAPVFALLGILISRAGRSLSHRLPVHLDRHRSATSPILARPWLGLALLVVALAAALPSLPDHYALRRRTAALPTMALAIWSQAEPGDVVLLVSGNRYPLFLYHYERMWSRALGMEVYEYPPDTPAKREDMPEVVPFPSRGSDILTESPEGGPAPEWSARLDELMADHPRIWLVEFGRDLQDPRDDVEAWLDARRPRVLSEGYGPDALHLFAEDDRSPSVMRASSRWPWMIRIDDFHDELGAPGEWLPVAGWPAPVAAAGDSVDLTLFARSADLAPALSPWLIADPEPREVMEIRRGELGDVTNSTPARLRLSVPIDERTPGGQHRFVARPLNERNVGLKGPGLPVRVIGAAPLVDSARERRSVARIGDYELDSADFTPSQLAPGGTLTLDLVWRNIEEVEAVEAAEATQNEPSAAPSYPAPNPEPGEGGRPSRPLGGSEDALALPIDPGVNRSSFALTPAVFAHLVGPPRPETGDPVWAVQDGPPSAGHWGRGPASNARIFDRHILTLDPEAPPGDYTLEIGLYDPVGGERLPVSGVAGGGLGEGVDVAARRVVLGTVRVVR